MSLQDAAVLHLLWGSPASLSLRPRVSTNENQYLCFNIYLSKFNDCSFIIERYLWNTNYMYTLHILYSIFPHQY